MGAILVAGPGSVRDFTAVYHREFDYVWSCLRAMGVPHAEIEDAVQAVFLVVHRRLGEFDGRAQLRTWLFAIAARVASRGRRDRARTERRLVALADATATMPTIESLDESLAGRQILAWLGRFADGLAADMQDVFRRWFFDGQTPQEIADALGLSRNTVFSRLRLIRARLQRECERIAAHDDATLDAAERRRAKSRVRVAVLGLGTRATTWTVALAISAFAGVAGIAGITGIAGVATIAEPTRSTVTTEPIVRAAPEPTSAAPPIATLPAVLPEVGSTPTTPPPAIAARRTAAPRIARSEAEPARPADADLAASVALLAEIRTAIAQARDDAAADAIRRHAAAFPNGPLQLEREGFAAIVACRAEHDLRPARAFLAAHPGSALARRIASMCPISSPTSLRTSSDDATR